MPTYEVEIAAVVRKTYTVEADNEDDAVQEANDIFSVLNDDTPEDYEQNLRGVELVE